MPTRVLAIAVAVLAVVMIWNSVADRIDRGRIASCEQASRVRNWHTGGGTSYDTMSVAQALNRRRELPAVRIIVSDLLEVLGYDAEKTLEQAWREYKICDGWFTTSLIPRRTCTDQPTLIDSLRVAIGQPPTMVNRGEAP